MPDYFGVELTDTGGKAGAVRAAKTLSLLGALGCALAAPALLMVDDVHMRRAGWGWAIDAAVFSAALALLLLRRRWTANQAQALSLLVVATTFAAQVHADWIRALSTARFAPFEAFKLLALMVATIVPFRPALAYAVVATCAVMPVALYAAMPAEMRATMPVEEPWSAMAYPLIAAGILLYRLRAIRNEREVMRARAQREALERLAKVSLACRDLANSPLQSIELVRAQLVRQHPESRLLLDNLHRSLGRLRRMGEMLSDTERHVIWTSKEEAFDAAQVIAEYRSAAGS
jgi:hypothetical protein